MPNEKTRSLLRALRGLDRAIERVERFILAYGVILMAVVSIINVVGRNLLNTSLAFTDEISQILIILVTFLGIGYGVRHARHIRMSAVYDQLQGIPRKALMVIISLGTAVLMFVLTWYAAAYVYETATLGSVSPALRIPLYLIYLWVPVGFLLGGIQYLLATVRNLTTPGVHLSFQQEEAYEEPGSYI
jgi:C4-dicarboxylate transporter DctQ subunit